ncbi:hypothetical protein BRARA_H00642, partial [Brassica rapa]
MGSLNRMRSAHHADIKEKGILYEDDDEPIKLVDRDDSFVIKEFCLSLIGKILNPKKQNVEKLLQTMPSQWGLSERITANDLGNGKFLFNFMSEEDLTSVLRQGPFHYNFCMFVLVRWEPIVHDDYPWIVPFWVRLIGFPLHLWTDVNLRNIGGRLGHVDTLELTEGRMLIDVDSRRPLKFARKVEYEGDEVTIEIKYDKLFKHCSICGLLSHEKGYCPSLDVRSRLQQPERHGVFTRMQMNQEQSYHPHLTRDSATPYQQPSLQGRELKLSRNDNPHYSRYNVGADTRERNLGYRGPSSRTRVEDDRRGRHSDRIIHRREDYRTSNRYGGARERPGPYDRPTEQSWRVKSKRGDGLGNGQNEVASGATSRELVPYEHSSAHSSLTKRIMDEQRCGETTSIRKIASAIVTPSRVEYPMEENVTVRGRGDARVLSFSPSDDLAPSNDDDLIIGALDDMELVDHPVDDMLEEEIEGEDLLELDLMEMEGNQSQPRPIEVKGRSSNKKPKGTKKLGVKRNAPLSINNRKFEVLRRGSPSDFNEITGHNEKEGGRQRLDSSFLPFKQMLNDCGMLEFPFTGDMLSW